MHKFNSLRNRRQRRGGFTLMEVLLALAILVILGSVTVMSLSGVFFDAKNKAARSKIDSMKSSIMDYYISEGMYPQSIQQMTEISQKTGRRYIDKVELDPWGRDYLYQPPEGSNPNDTYKYWTVGADGQEGTADDISNL